MSHRAPDNRRLHADRPDPLEPQDDRGLPQVVRPLPTAEDPLAGSTIRRALVEAHDRLADRMLQRLRAMRDDIDADLAELRSEMSALRHSIDDAGDRVPIRQMRTSLEELRADVAALRRVGLPEVDADALAAGGRVAEELAALRNEIAALRRRISLRAVAESPGLSDEQLHLLAELVAERMRATGTRRRR